MFSINPNDLIFDYIWLFFFMLIIYRFRFVISFMPCNFKLCMWFYGEKIIWKISLVVKNEMILKAWLILWIFWKIYENSATSLTHTQTPTIKHTYYTHTQYTHKNTAFMTSHSEHSASILYALSVIVHSVAFTTLLC